MLIKKIKIENFKSFNELKIELDNFNIIIGSNASGKSNFIQIFKFIKDLWNQGLENALSLQGDVEFLRNIAIGSSKDFILEITLSEVIKNIFEFQKKTYGILIYEYIYLLGLDFNDGKSSYKISKEEIKINFDIYELRGKIDNNKQEITEDVEEEEEEEEEEKDIILPLFSGVLFTKERYEEEELIGKGSFKIFRHKGKIKFVKEVPNDIPMKITDIFICLINEGSPVPKNKTFFKSFIIIPPYIERALGNIAIYDIDPKLPKKMVPFTGKKDLEEDGNNLAIALNNVFKNEKARKKFINLMKDIFPFFDDIGIRKFADKYLLLQFKESYCKDNFLPGSFLSDGTINITALLVTLFFEKKPLILIEEPERNIHPRLISKVVNIMKEASSKKQIIITTHHPEIVKHVDIKNLLLISRNHDGFSCIKKPSESEEVQQFLKDEIGIDELFKQNLLED